MTNKEKIINAFNKVKDLGFVESLRKNNTGIGHTFEYHMGVVENNARNPDLYGYELKSKRKTSTSFLTLFTKCPCHPSNVNAYLRDTYGTPYENNTNLKKIHTSMFANRGNTYKGLYSFKLVNDRINEIIKIAIFDINGQSLIDDSIYYRYRTIETTLNSKLFYLFFVVAETEMRGEKEFFHFTRAEIYENPTLENFLKLVDEGLIMYDIRLGSHLSGKKFGELHDHGSGFRIKPVNLNKLFDIQEILE